MSLRITTAAGLAALLALLAGNFCQAKTATPKNYVSEETRNIVGSRKVVVVIRQTEIMPGIAAWNLGEARFNDPLEDLINDAKTGRGEKFIEPLRAALRPHDFDTRMFAALRKVVEQCSWMRAQDIELTRDGSGKNIERLLNDSNTRQMLVLLVTYATDFHYDSIVVSVEASMLVRQVPRGEHSQARLRKDYIPYFQAFRSIVELPHPDHSDVDVDLARWSADNASLARAALDFGIERLPSLLAKNLEETQQETQTWRGRNERKTVERAGMPGWVIGKQDDATIFVEARGGAVNLLRTLPDSTH
jgi:hypothetical protein